MMTSTRRLGWLALALFALVGCDNASQPTTPPPSTTAPGPKNDVKALPVEPDKGADAGKLTSEEIAEIKNLPEAEQSSALAQMTCPSSGAHLGKMGTPIKQTIGDKSFYICCKGCIDDVKENPQGILAKLNKK
jgi:hypothetical protein